MSAQDEIRDLKNCIDELEGQRREAQKIVKKLLEDHEATKLCRAELEELRLTLEDY